MQTPTRQTVKAKLLDGLLRAEKLGATAAKLSCHQGTALGCSFESGKLKRATSNEQLGYSVYVLANGRLGVTAGNIFGDVTVMVERAMALAQAGSVAHFSSYPAAAPYQAVRGHAPRTLELTREDMIGTCQGLVDRLRRCDSDLDIHAGCSRGESAGILVTSGGLCYESESTYWSLGAGVQRTQGTDMLFAGNGRVWGDLDELFDPDWLAEDIETSLERSRLLAEPPRGDSVCFLPPNTLSAFLSPVIAGLSGRSVAKGTSPLKDHLGERYFSPNLTLVDDPHVDFSPGGAEIDADGIPTRRTTLIDKGTIALFLYDLDSAGLAGAQPTGHSNCSPYLPHVLPGTLPSDKLLESIDDGLYIKELLGFGQSNIANGDFSCNVALGFRIQNGHITGRVKNTMIAGNIFEILRNNVQFSSDRDPLSRMPHAVVSGISVHSAME